MVKRVLVALLLIPFLDALGLVVVSGFIGWQVTVLLVVLTGLIGLLFVRAEGRHTLRRFERRVQSGQLPTNELLDGAFLIAAGAFLLTPGLITDAIGFLFVIPFTRYPLREFVKRFVVVPYVERRSGGFVSGRVYTAGFPDQDDGFGDDFVDIGGSDEQ